MSEDKAEAGEKDFFAIGLGDDVAFVPTDIFARYVKSKTPKNQDGIFTKNNTFNVEGGAEIRLPNNNTIRFEGRVRRTKGKVLFPEKLQNKYGLPPEETFKDRGTNVGAFYSKQNKDENIGGSVGLNYDAEAGKFREFNASGFLRNIFGNDSLKASASFNPTNKKASGRLEYTSKFNDGGLTMNKQMELFEEGGQVDPVSGNDVPLGSTEEEVRDDQPAMLSEGEMVIPADVVRYFGVEHFMKLRDEAKMGYKKMEAMGQFGTEEGQTLPDDALFNAGGPPFTVEDIEVIEPDDLENLEGGEETEIEAANGALVRNFAEGGMTTYTERMIGGNANPATQQAPLQPLVPDIGRVASVPVPGGLGQLVGSTGFGANTERFFMDPTGAISSIFFFDGMPQQEVDEDLLEIDSPFELRSYAELGGGVSKAATDKEKKEVEEEFAGDGGDTDNSTGSAEYGSVSEMMDAIGDTMDAVGAGIGMDQVSASLGSEASGSDAPDPGCVIATHAVSHGVFTQTEKAKAVIWCKQNLHNTWYGEAFRRGYRWHGNRAIAKGVKPTHYKEFNSFVNFVTGKKRTLKGSLTVCKRAVQFFVTGLFVKG